jgi:thioesterase domain-containing protein
LILLDAQPSNDSSVTPALLENNLLEEVLRFYSVDIPEQDEPLTYQQVEELVRERGAVEFSQYKQFVDLIAQNLKSSMSLHRAHKPAVFDGDMIIFSALRDDEDRNSSLLQSWRPYVAGDITEYSIDCTHKDMLSTESLSTYGKQLEQSLVAVGSTEVSELRP